MSINFSKRIKKPEKTDSDMDVDMDLGESSRAPPQSQANSTKFNSHFVSKKNEPKKKSELQKTFAEENKKVKTGDEISKTVLNKTSNLSATEGMLLSDDDESKYLKRMLSKGHEIIEENMEKLPWTKGIVEVKMKEDDQLKCLLKYETSIQDHIKTLIKRKLFKEKSLLIPNEDIVAKGGIYVTLKQKGLDNDKNKQNLSERVKEYLQHK